MENTTAYQKVTFKERDTGICTVVPDDVMLPIASPEITGNEIETPDSRSEYSIPNPLMMIEITKNNTSQNGFLAAIPTS